MGVGRLALGDGGSHMTGERLTDHDLDWFHAAYLQHVLDQQEQEIAADLEPLVERELYDLLTRVDELISPLLRHKGIDPDNPDE